MTWVKQKMKIYLVGGAVRDELLGYPVVEHDYVVVGASPEEMTAQGFIPVGKDFPVFLHPDTKDEYALARTERKCGHGYHGFEFNTAPNVTLEEDLKRRDLTVNAIAKSESGEIIDPLGGRQDIQNKTLKHIGDAFQEDPVRILRIARFAARYAHLGFTIHPDTMQLMQTMVKAGEVDHLVPERVWKEFSRALEEKSPHIFITSLFGCGALRVIAPTIANLLQTEKCDVNEHSAIKALVLASQSSKSIKIRLATFLREINEESLTSEFFQSLSIPNECRDLIRVTAQSREAVNHASHSTPEEIVELFTRTDAFRKPERFLEMLECAKIFHEANHEAKELPQYNFLHACLTACLNVLPAPFVKQGFKGPDIGKKVQEERVRVISQMEK